MVTLNFGPSLIMKWLQNLVDLNPCADKIMKSNDTGKIFLI